MQEALRRMMLEDMGLRVYQPRFQFPGAKASVALSQGNMLDNVADDVVIRPVAETSSSNTATQSLSDKAHNIFPSETVSDITQETVQAASSPVFSEQVSELFPDKTVLQIPVTGQSEVMPIRFRYRIVRVGDFLMLVDQPTLEWSDAARCKSFFSEVHFALTNKRYEYWQDAQFDWPPVKHFPMANNEEMSKQALHTFVQQHLHQPPCRWIFLWGEPLTRQMLEQPVNTGDTGFWCDIPVLALGSCQQYWQEPQKKKLLWQYLQSVKKSLPHHA